MHGALANDPDTAVYFTYPANDNGALTNSLFVPHVSPLSTLNPPFSVECWFYPTNGNQGDIWSQSSDSGLNGGNYASNAGNVCGIRMDWSGTNNGFNVFSYDNDPAVNQLIQSGNSSANDVPAGQWYQLVVTCDAGTNVTLYVNGTAVGSVNASGRYSPDYWTPFRVGSGNGTGGFRSVGGIIDEVSIYTNVISDIGGHYNDAVSGAAGAYFEAVTNDNPVIYLRMDSSAYAPAPSTNWPALINYGSVGLNGFYTPGTVPGIVSGPATPNGTPFAGLSGADVPLLSGVSSFADAGYSTAYNPVGATPFSVSAIFRGNPCDNRPQVIVGHSGNSWSLAMNNQGELLWQLGANAESLTSAGVYNDGQWHQVVAVYSPNSNPAVPGTGALYVDGVLDTLVNNVSTNGIGPGTNLDVMIGSDPQYTNNPVGLGAQFAGQICEVALFTNALTSSQIQTLNYAAGIAPYVTGNPVTGRTINGGLGSYIYFGVLDDGSQ
ncbi:MAG: LamG domain-containing protein, partial [Limisphaerales bacterium]